MLYPYSSHTYIHTYVYNIYKQNWVEISKCNYKVKVKNLRLWYEIFIEKKKKKKQINKNEIKQDILNTTDSV